ncbi:putative tetratricopeptide repeat protein 41 [Tenrec ecaudatus]|uniref:putative tetratricopeptide repeat protein 41 n=1 Tax=Tenrec ecaudatus TaxID=94439 RepID=UPI003F597BF7
MSQKGNKNEERSAQASLTPQKPIRPYICSTPKDLQEERDFLARHVFPELNERCQARGTYFKAVDLRCSGLESPAPVAPHLLRQHSCLASQHLKLCLDCVNSCLPFFICVLGQAYGDFLQDYAPGIFSRATDLSSLSPAEQKLYVAAKNGYPWVLESPSCSLTELEVTQAAFRNASPFQYFYFRTGPSRPQSSDREKEGPSPSSLKRDMEKLKMGKLKAKILSRGLPVRFYRSLQELGELVFKDWSAVIESLYPSTVMLENIDYKHSFERSYHEEFTKKCEQEFVISKESNRIFEALERFALKDVEFDLNGAASASSLDSVLRFVRINPLPTYKSILLVSGERGCGKSTLIANWVNYFRKKHPRMLLVPYFVGSTCDSSDIMSVIHYFITELQDKIYGTPLETDVLHEDPSLWVFSLLVERFLASISLKPCILVLDGIEELIGIYGISGPKAKDFSWLPCSLAPHCKFILSTVSSSLSYKALCARPDVRTMELISTGEAEAQLRIFRQHLSTPSSDPFRQRRQALRKKTNLNPLKLTILASESKECRIYRNELQCMKAYLEVPSIQDLWELILKRWVEDYSWNFTRKKGSSDALASGEGLDGWVADTLCLLSISHCGLAEEEILQLLDMLGYRDQHTVTLLHWAAFRNASKEWVLEKPDGLLCFRHQSLRKAVEHRLLGGTAPVRECGPYAFQNPTNHKKTQLHQALVSYFQQHAAFWRVFQELPWHLKMSGSWEDLCNFLTSPNVTDFLSKLRSPSFWTRLHLLHYWGVLTEVGYDVTRTYLLSVDKIKTSPCHKAHARGTLFLLWRRIVRCTTSDKCRLLAFIARVLKHMGNTKEAEQLLLDVEDILVQNQSPMEMLSTVQNALGELYLEIGMTQEAFQYFLRAWSTLTCLPPSDLKTNQNLVKQQGRVLNNLTKSGSEEFLKQNYILEYATELAQLLDNNPNDQATMKYTEGVLRLAAGNVSLAKMKFQECLNIRRSLFGKTNILVGEIMEYLADLLFFPLHGERFQRKQVIDYYKQVVKIKENTEALTNSSLIRKQLCISLSDTLCKLAGQLLLSDSSHHLTMEAVGYLYRSLDLRTTYLGAAHPSIPGIVNLLKEIDRLQGRRYYLPDICHQSAEGWRTGGPLGKDVRKLRYHSSQNSHTVSSALCLDADQLQRAKSADFALNPISDASECISGKQNKSLRPITCIPVRKKTRPKTQNHVELWNRPEKETSKKKKPFPSKILALGEMNSVVKLSRQRVTSTSGSGTQQITTIYQHPLVEALSSAQPLDSVVELISEKWLFHSPDSSLTPQKYFWRRKPQMDTKWYQPLNDTNKE